ncbi:elymoclavine monooxygenase [Penicillium hetheringtonii]|uniref:Elymoclavine monooxygenase n=1 Tax=Penicillium hetheringtonii TaxID=911720 RepID=A0AAD6DNI4_9EURO|nr:elymoclavine monooxygenase [Penicillium hetheringtonii]
MMASPQIILLLIFVWVATCIFQRLFFHPLSHVPGPRLAAVSRLYGFYYNVFGEGYSKQFSGLHERYKSSVIRISPDAVHVNDPDFYQMVFASKTNYRKDPQFYHALDGKGVLLGITDDQQYRSYRAHMSPLFSVRFTADLAPTVMLELKRMSGFLEKKEGCRNASGNTISLSRIHSRHLTVRRNFPEGTRFMEATKQLQKAVWLVIQFPSVMSLFNYLPAHINAILSPELTWFNKHCANWFEQARENRKNGIEVVPKRFFDISLDVHSSSDPKLKDIVSPVADAYNLLAAGMDTTSYNLSCATFFLLDSPHCLSRLQNELAQAGITSLDSMDLKKIQNLPYLTAVIKESLRLSTGQPGFLPRVVPSEGAHIGSTFIPGGVKITITSQVVQLDPKIFPEPLVFRPERWLDNKSLDRWHVGFSKGPRKCIGMNLANLQLYSCLAYIFARYDMQLFKTDKRSLEWVDSLIAQTVGPPINVKILKDRWE